MPVNSDEDKLLKVLLACHPAGFLIAKK